MQSISRRGFVISTAAAVPRSASTDRWSSSRRRCAKAVQDVAKFKVGDIEVIRYDGIWERRTMRSSSRTRRR